LDLLDEALGEKFDRLLVFGAAADNEVQIALAAP
jgi:hypothetical protein